MISLLSLNLEGGLVGFKSVGFLKINKSKLILFELLNDEINDEQQTLAVLYL